MLNRDITVDGCFSIGSNPDNNAILLCDGCTLQVKGLSYSYGGLGMNIYGQVQNSGRLISRADSGSGGPGLGTWNDTYCGNLTIHGGTIEAIGGNNAAGIGTKSNGVDNGNIRIYGGTVTATGGSDGAGIGGGTSKGFNRDEIWIYGGTVTATGNGRGAGIGYKDDGTVCVHINGGTVTAIGGSTGAGIGGGERGNAEVTIVGGDVTVRGGTGIGDGASGTGSTITLDFTEATMDSISVSAPAYGGKVTLVRLFALEGSDKIFPAGEIADNSEIGGGTLVGVDDVLHTHDEIAFQRWRATDSLPTEQGSYYLNDDVTLKDLGWSWKSGTLNLCLNGHTIKGDGTYQPVLEIAGGEVNLYDEENGAVTQMNGRDATIVVWQEAAFTQYGGTVSGRRSPSPAWMSTGPSAWRAAL